MTIIVAIVIIQGSGLAEYQLNHRISTHGIGSAYGSLCHATGVCKSRGSFVTVVVFSHQCLYVVISQRSHTVGAEHRGRRVKDNEAECNRVHRVRSERSGAEWKRTAT